MGFFDKVTFLNASLCLENQILHVIVHCHGLVQRAWSGGKWDRRRFQDGDFTAEADTSKWILNHWSEHIWRLHPDLLGEAASFLLLLRLHVEFLHHQLQDVELALIHTTHYSFSLLFFIDHLRIHLLYMSLPVSFQLIDEVLTPIGQLNHAAYIRHLLKSDWLSLLIIRLYYCHFF